MLYILLVQRILYVSDFTCVRALYVLNVRVFKRSSALRTLLVLYFTYINKFKF